MAVVNPIDIINDIFLSFLLKKQKLKRRPTLEISPECSARHAAQQSIAQPLHELLCCVVYRFKRGISFFNYPYHSIIVILAVILFLIDFLQYIYRFLCQPISSIFAYESIQNHIQNLSGLQSKSNEFGSYMYICSERKY